MESIARFRDVSELLGVTRRRFRSFVIESLVIVRGRRHRDLGANAARRRAGVMHAKSSAVMQFPSSRDIL